MPAADGLARSILCPSPFRRCSRRVLAHTFASGLKATGDPGPADPVVSTCVDGFPCLPGRARSARDPLASRLRAPAPIIGAASDHPLGSPRPQVRSLTPLKRGATRSFRGNPKTPRVAWLAGNIERMAISRPEAYLPAYLYKASEARYLDAMQRGIFKVTRLSEFRNVERYGQHIGDDSEGTKTVHVPHYQVPTEISQNGQVFRSRFIGCTNVSYENCRFSTSVDNVYILSLSSFQSVDLLRSINADSASHNLPPYTGFLEFTDVLDFSGRVAQAFEAVAGVEVTWGPHSCIYCQSLYTFPSDGDPSYAIEFSKDPRYAYQAEWRIAIRPHSVLREPSFIIEDPVLASFIRRRFDYVDSV